MSWTPPLPKKYFSISVTEECYLHYLLCLGSKCLDPESVTSDVRLNSQILVMNSVITLSTKS